MAAPVIQPSRVEGAAPKIGVEAKLFPCQGGACMFWNAERSTCGIKLGFEALPRVEKLLAPLAGLFKR